MATALNRLQGQFSAANTVSLAAAGNVTSDDLTLSVAAWGRELRVKGVSDANCVAGDTVELHWQGRGDPDGDATNDYDTDGTFLGRLDVGAASSTFQRPWGLAVLAQTGRLYAVSQATGAVTLSFEVVEITA